MIRGLDKRTSGDLVRLVVFMVTTALATSVLIITIGNLSFGAKKDYAAEFVDATGVNKGDDIRIAGVKVGSVEDVKVVGPHRALVKFKVDADTVLNDATHARIRYRNLLGQRYISLFQEGDTGKRLDEDAKIPTKKTEPALDLTVLFNGFKPLFEALSPDDINKGCPTRSSRSSRARAAPSRACSPAPPRSPRPWPTATRSSGDSSTTSTTSSTTSRTGTPS
ncbi:MlaD family protein [Nocardioides convexus]|uniref:MlaD family protein n=1 Tax=Nocardioides convexus TaxID=2712224 RepID=UPI0024187A63|nr:MlaD family protein [Nocardioides convexus]